ncbi:MAG: hypothetical protein JWO31_879, partial [Phycisphaerales bacterium]|nr:hypothetical protein [Phycisphaerales bacterium]
ATEVRETVAGLADARRDAGVRFVFHLLARLPLAARADGDFSLALRDEGVTVPPEPSFYDLIGGFAEAVDDHLLRAGGRTDFAEMAQMAAAESLAAVARAGSAILYGTTATEVRETVAGLATERGFADLAHGFFARLIERFLNYHLSRELSAHVGPGRRFADIDAHEAFAGELRTTAEEMAVIVRRFAGQWYGKTRYETGVTPAKARDFVHGAFTKIGDELARRGGASAQAS